MRRWSQPAPEERPDVYVPRLSAPRSSRSWSVLLGAGSASAATDHVVITGGAVVPAGQTAGDVVVLDGTVRIAGHATGDVVSVSGPVRVTGRVDGDLIAVSDRAFLGSTARVGGDLRYGDERPVLARGASVGGKISKEDWADAANGWGWVGVVGVVAGGVGVDADRRRAARLAGAGRAVRRRAGGARAPRRHDRVGRCDRDRRAAAGGPGARHARGHPVRRRALVGRDPRAARRVRDNRLDRGATGAAQPLDVAMGGAALPAGGSCACWPSSPSPAPSSGSRRRSWDSERWPSRCGGPAGPARPRRVPTRRLRALPLRPRDGGRQPTPGRGCSSPSVCPPY